jgi:hypothetical protein
MRLVSSRGVFCRSPKGSRTAGQSLPVYARDCHVVRGGVKRHFAPLAMTILLIYSKVIAMSLRVTTESGRSPEGIPYSGTISIVDAWDCFAPLAMTTLLIYSKAIAVSLRGALCRSPKGIPYGGTISSVDPRDCFSRSSSGIAMTLL